MKSSQISAAEMESRVTRFGLRVAAGLTERNADLAHDVSERLRFAREQALARAAQARAASVVASPDPVVVQQGATLALGGGPRGAQDGLWAKLISALPLLLLLAGLLLAQQGRFNEQIAAQAEVDTALLSDNLPPAAFSDPGFAEFLRDGEE